MAVAEGVGAAAPEVGPQEAELKPPASVKFFYSLGQVVESSYLSVATFVFFYYTAVLGLSGTLVGVALAISMCLDAAGDPLIGSWSDNVRSRFGRRLPLMLLGGPLTMITMGLLFAPPQGLSTLALFGWLTLTMMGVRFFASLYNIPYFALGGELSDGYVERARIVSYRLLGGLFAGVLVNALAYSVFFAGAGGLQRAGRYPAFGWAIGTAVLVGSLACCAGVWRYARSLPQPTTPPSPVIRGLAPQLVEIFRNRSFRTLFLGMLMFATAAGVSSALNNHTYVFVWRMRPELIQLIAYAYLFGILLGIPMTPFLLRRMEKKTCTALGFALVIVAWLILPILRALGLFTPTGAEALPWLIATTLVVGVGSGFIFIALPAMMADAADEHEHLFGSRREGLYFAGLGFAGKAAGGLGAMLGGFALDLLRFPREVGQQIDAVVAEDVLRKLIIAWGPFPGVLCALGAIAFWRYGITRSRHDAISAALKVKRADDVRAGRST